MRVRTLSVLLSCSLAACATGGSRTTSHPRRTFAGTYEEVYSAFLQKLVADTPGYVVTRGERSLSAANDLTRIRFEFVFHPGASLKETVVEARASSPAWTEKEAAEAATDALGGLGLWLSPELRANLRVSENAGQVSSEIAVPRQPSQYDRVLPRTASDVDRPRYRLPERDDRFAVVVGIGKYAAAPEARFAEADADAVQNHLRAMGFPRRNIVSLSGQDASYSALKKHLESWLPMRVPQGGRVFFYFAGHGAPDPGTGEAYLVPWDGDPAFLKDTAYPLQRLYAQLSALPAAEVFVAVDACFSGAGGRSVLAQGARPLVLMLSTGTVPSERLAVFTASEAGQITSVMEDEGHGTFTYYFLKGLDGAAQDPAGAVSAKGLFDYLKPKVQDEARRQNREQTPTFFGRKEDRLR